MKKKTLGLYMVAILSLFFVIRESALAKGNLVSDFKKDNLVTVADSDTGEEIVCPSGSLREGKIVKNYTLCNVKEEKNGLIETVNKIITVVLGVIVLVAVFVVILGGFQYTVSQGDPGKVKKAKDTILYGIVGLVIALLAFGIVNFILKNLF